jgi:hypothetical protein
MHEGCSLEYPTQEPPMPTHYAKGNMSLLVGLQKCNQLHTVTLKDDCCMKLRDVDIGLAYKGKDIVFRFIMKLKGF